MRNLTFTVDDVPAERLIDGALWYFLLKVQSRPTAAIPIEIPAAAVS